MQVSFVDRGCSDEKERGAITRATRSCRSYSSRGEISRHASRLGIAISTIATIEDDNDRGGLSREIFGMGICFFLVLYFASSFLRIRAIAMMFLVKEKGKEK